jgi:hypothetical protein
LKFYPLQIGRQCPWQHTKEELEIITKELEKESNPFSLDKACPHIVRAFKLFCRALFGKQHPLAHPNKGLTQCTILYYVCDQTHSVRLTIVMQNLDYEFFWFPKMQYDIEDVLQA